MTYNIKVKHSVVGFGFKSFIYLRGKIVWRSNVKVSRHTARKNAERTVLAILEGC